MHQVNELLSMTLAQMPGLSIDQFVGILTSGGGYAVMAVWLWSERKERLRLQRLLEQFLPLMAGTQRAMKNVSRVISGGEDE